MCDGHDSHVCYSLGRVCYRAKGQRATSDGLTTFTFCTPLHDTLQRPYNDYPQMNFFASMPFNFSFRISVPGLSNPFSALARSQASADITYQPHSKQSHPPLNPAYSPPQNHHVQDLINTAMLSDSWTVLASTPSRLPSPSPAPSAPAHPSRKRGWLPASAEPSQAIVYAAATSAFLDTPSKCRDMADDNLSQSQRDEVIVGTYSSFILRPKISIQLYSCSQLPPSTAHLFTSFSL